MSVELKEFIAQTLSDILNGVIETQQRTLISGARMSAKCHRQTLPRSGIVSV